MATDADAHVLLDALFASTAIGLGVWDTELRYVRVNPALARLHGIAPADHVGRTPSDLFGDLGRRGEAVMRRVMEERRPRVDASFEGAMPSAPGERRTFETTMFPVLGDDGEVLGVGAMVMEARDTAAAESGAASALLDAIFGAAPVGIAFWDRELRYRRVNDALAAINDVPAEEHLGRTPDDVLPAPLGGRMTEMLQEVARTREPIVDRELSSERRDGTTQFRQTTIFPVVDARAELTGLAGVVRDVTAQHSAETERTALLRDALTARAAAEAAQVRAESAHADAEEARARTDFLYRVSERLIAVSSDYEATLQEVARIAVPTVADWCTFTLLDERGVPRTAAVAAAEPGKEALARELVARWPIRLDAPAGAGYVLRTGEPQLVEDLSADLLERMAADEEHLAILRSLELRSGLTVPLAAQGRTIGALTLVYSTSGRRYGPEDVRLARTLAARAALAVENARLNSDRLHVAQTLQRSLLPPALPDVPGLELAVRYRAAGAANEVGGDFYDVFRAAGDVWTVVIGDVSGKGAEAAALTSLTRHTLRAAALRPLQPVEHLELLNEVLYDDPAAAGRFSTVLVAQVRPDAGGAEVTLATGGHLPPVVLRAGGRVERLQLRGAIVGGLRAPSFGERRVRLDADDLLLLYTDGVVELRAPGARRVVSGDAALEQTLHELRGAPADELVAAVERSAVELQGGDPRDDIALLALRPRP